MKLYKIEYRLSNRHKWRALSVSSRVPFTKADHDSYSHMLADRHMVSWLLVQLRQIEVTP